MDFDCFSQSDASKQPLAAYDPHQLLELHKIVLVAIMLDVFDFIEEKGGEPKKVKESQRRRHAPEEAVDEVITLYEDARKTKYAASQAKQQINAVQKEIQAKKKVCFVIY